MRRTRPTPTRVAEAVALSAALAALALALRDVPALFLALAGLTPLALALPFVEWPSVHPGVARVLPRALGITLLALAGFAWLSRALGALVLQPSFLPLVGAPLLVPIALLFAVAPRAFPFGRTLAPVVVGILALAGLNPSPSGYGGSALPFLRSGEHSSFAELYVCLALVVLGSLWAAAFLERGPRWHPRDVVGLALVAGACAGLAATGVAGLPLLQPKVEQALASTLDQGMTGLSGESRLGEFAKLAVSRRRVLDLQASDDQAGPWLLRSEVFPSFDGRRWTSGSAVASSAGRPAQTLPPTTPPAAVGPLLTDIGAWFALPQAGGTRDGADVEIRINQRDVDGWPLLLPRRVSAVTVDAPVLEVDRFGCPRRPFGLSVHLYGARVESGDGLPLTADPSLSDAERAENLALPPVVDARVLKLAHDLVPSGGARERLAATISHLRGGFGYTLEPGRFHGGDPIAQFLFEKKAGYCEYFASAAVVLLRLQGVPARFVKGLSVGPQTDQGGGLHVVRESNAHAWVEAWLPDVGWVEADPTPPGALAGTTEERESPLARLLEHARAAISAAWARLLYRGAGSLARQLASDLAHLLGQAVRQPLLWLAAATVLTAPRLVRSLLVWRRRRRRVALDTASVPADLRALVRGIERRWAALGRPRPPARGLLEHWAALDTEPTLAARATAAEERVLLETYYRARFGGEPGTPRRGTRLRGSPRSA